MDSNSVGPKWIKPELFASVLKEIEPNFRKILKFNSSPALKPGENYATLMLSVVIKIELTDNTTKNVYLMMKNKLESEFFDELNKLLDVFVVEKDMYFTFVPEFEKIYREAGLNVKFTAPCYDLNVNEEYILLDDLRQIGFQSADRIAGLDMNHVKCAIEKIAQFHAASMVRVETNGPYPKKFFFENQIDAMELVITTGANMYVKCLTAAENASEYGRKVKHFCENLIQILKRESQYDSRELNVLCHGDFWTNNILFKYNEEGKPVDCRIVDYQVPKYCSPVIDLFQIIMGSTKTELKVPQFEYFIKFYHDHLTKNLKLLNYVKSLPKLRDLHISFLKNTVYAFFMTILTPAATMMESSADSNIENLVGISDETMAFQRRMYENPRFREHLEIIKPWLLNRGYLD